MSPRFSLAVTLEGEVFGGVDDLDVLYSAASFDRADEIAFLVIEACHTARLPFEWGFDSCSNRLGIPQIKDLTSCPFMHLQGRRRHRSDLDVTSGGTDDKKLSANVHGVDSVGEHMRIDGSRRTTVPIGQTFVPRSRQQIVMLIDKGAFLDAAFMLSHLLQLIRRQIPELDLHDMSARFSDDGTALPDRLFRRRRCRGHLD